MVSSWLFRTAVDCWGNLPSDMYLGWRCVSESAPHFVVLSVGGFAVLFYKWLNNRVIRSVVAGWWL